MMAVLFAPSPAAGAWVERVLLEPSSSSGGAADEGGAHPRRKKAVGVLAYAGSCPAPLRLAIQVGGCTRKLLGWPACACAHQCRK